jgi:hypothetical protein
MILFTIVTKVKYLRIDSTKEVKDVYTEKLYKTDKKLKTKNK